MLHPCISFLSYKLIEMQLHVFYDSETENYFLLSQSDFNHFNAENLLLEF